jgi:beta-galactosidase/beta-glucuronidase
VRVNLANVSHSAQRASVSGRFGGRGFALKGRTLKAGKEGAVSGSLRVRHPRLWSPRHPNLYPVRLTVRAGGRAVGGYVLHSGVRSIKVVKGRLLLNGRPLNFRGVGLHEEVNGKGFALS